MEQSEITQQNESEEKPKFSGGGITRTNPRLASIKGRSLSLSVVALPSVGIVVTPSPDEPSIVQESSCQLVGGPSCKPLQIDKPIRARPRLSIPAIFSSTSTSPSPLLPTASISSLLTVAANRGFSFSSPLSGLRRASWSVSF